MNKPARKKWLLRILITLGLLLLLVILIVLIAFFTIKSNGDRALAHIQESQVLPDLKFPNTGKFSDSQEGLENGQIRYQGQVYNYNKDIQSFLVLGIDKDEPVTPATDGISGGQSDAIFLVIVNPHTKTVKLLAINRNTKTPIDVYDKEGHFVIRYPLQITLQHGYGDGMQVSCERSVSAVSNFLYKLPITGYFSVNRGAIAVLNDAVGGVTVDVLNDIIYPGEITLHKGENHHLVGREAYFYTATRHIEDFASADLRLARQRQYLGAFVSTFRHKLKTNPLLPLHIYDVISDYSVTDLSMSELISLFVKTRGYTFDQTVYTPEGTTDRKSVV